MSLCEENKSEKSCDSCNSTLSNEIRMEEKQ